MPIAYIKFPRKILSNKRTKKCKYLHTLNGNPAFYSEPDGQICYVTTYYPGKLCNSLKQVRKEQKLTLKNRKKWGYHTDKHDYSYVRIYI